MRFVRDPHPPAAGLEAITAYVTRRQAGVIVVDGRNVNPRVSSILVVDDRRRVGVGTALYLAAARLACRQFGAPLHSDFERSVAAQAFWEKQVKKGRAVCVAAASAPVADGSNSGPILNRGGCVQYRLTCPVPTSLRGRR